MEKWYIKTINIECYWRERKEDGECKATGITCSKDLCPLIIKNLKPKKSDNSRKTQSALCVCGHDNNFHDVLDNYACHSMDCDCNRFSKAD